MKIAWISSFPIEWLPDLPDPLGKLPRLHPATWQRVLLEEFKSRRDLQLEIVAVRTSFPQSCVFNYAGVNVHCLKVPKGTRTFSLFWWDTIAIRRCLKRIAPTMVHAWGTERGAALVASRLGYPYLVTMQGLLQWYSQQAKVNVYHQLDACLERIALKRAAVVTTESTFAVAWLREHYPHLKVHQAEHAPNWLFHRLERRPQLNPVQFLFIGVMGFIKGTDLLLRALDQLRDTLNFRLTIIGVTHSDFIRNMQACTSASLWERITIHRGLTPAQVGEELARTTLLLFPTRADTSPNAVKEAVVAGVPVVATAVGGIVDYVLPGRNGVLVRPNDLEALKGGIRDAVADGLFGRGQVDPETLKQMRHYLSPALMAERFLQAYRIVQG